MYRPLCIAAGMYVLGVLSEKYSIIKLPFFFILAAVYLLAARINECKKKEFVYHLFVISIGFVMVFLGKSRASCIKEVSELQTVMESIGTENIKICGCVDDILYEKQGKKVVLSDLSIQKSQTEINVKSEKIFVYTEKEDIAAGDTVTVYGNLKFYAGCMNEGEFDIRNYYLTRNIAAYIYSDNISIIQENKSPVGKLKAGICFIREKLVSNTERALPEKESGIIISMLSGDKSYIDADVKEDFQNTGFAHILAISGLHISILGMSLFKLIQKDKTKYLFPSAMTLIILCMYSMLTGGQVSCVRAVFSLIFTIFSSFLGRKNDGLTTLSFSALLILIKTPAYLYDISFLLSYTAGLGIVLYQPIGKEIDKIFRGEKDFRDKRKNAIGQIKARVVKASAFSVFIQLCIMPVQLHFFYKYCPYSFILNSLLLPVVDIVLVSGMAGAGLGSISALISKVAAFPSLLILKVYESSCDIAGSLPFSEVYTGVIGYKRTGLLVLGILFICFLVKKHMLKQAFFLLPLIFTLILPFKSDNLKIAHLFVGQGDCCVITCGKDAIIMDCGSSDIKNIYHYTVESYLNYMGYEYPDYIFLSHGDEDHVNGLMEECFTEKSSNVKIIIPDLINDEGFNKVKECGAQIISMTPGQRAQISDMIFTCLYPGEGNNYETSNDSSMVMLLEYEEFRELFMGDLPETKEKTVVESLENMGINSVNTIKAGHHGSKTSTGEYLLNHIKTDTAIISCGIDNSYGHPHKETIEKLEAFDVKIFRTDRNGECSISLRKDYNVSHDTYVH